MYKSISAAALVASTFLAVPSFAAPANPHGHAAPMHAVPDRVVMIMAGKSANIAVKRLETIRITDGTKTVTWTFDTVGTASIALDKIFPGAMGTIYVDESPYYAG